MSEFNYELLGHNESVGFVLDETSPAYLFRGGKSYFKAYKLPEYKSPYLIAVKTYAIGEVVDRFHIFSPKLTILDENYSVARDIHSERLDFERVKFGESLSAGGGSPIAAEVSLVIDSPEYKYIVIHTTDKQLLGHSINHAPDFGYIPMPQGAIIYPTGKYRHFTIPHSPFGKLLIKTRMHNSQISP
jgi:maltose operon protein